MFIRSSAYLFFWNSLRHTLCTCNVVGRDATTRPDAIQFIKNTLGMNQAGVQSLKATESFLLRQITEDSSKIEECFQIAFVISVMGHKLTWMSFLVNCFGYQLIFLALSPCCWQSLSVFLFHSNLQVFMLENLDLGTSTRNTTRFPALRHLTQIGLEGWSTWPFT
jgi:hypothetical protein